MPMPTSESITGDLLHEFEGSGFEAGPYNSVRQADPGGMVYAHHQTLLDEYESDIEASFGGGGPTFKPGQDELPVYNV